MRPAFQIAGGTVIGREHARAGRNGQDAFAWGERDGVLAAAVTDGCSSAPHSEVGARLGARIVVDALLRGGSAADVTAAVLGRLRAVADALGGATGEVVHDYLLFTIVAVAIGGETARVLAAGDGLVVVNGARVRLGPFPDDAPPYLGYALLDHDACALAPVVEIATADLTAMVLASDGAAELDEPWRDEAFFVNPDQVRRRLTLLWRDGVLGDDATVVTVRRRP